MVYKEYSFGVNRMKKGPFFADSFLVAGYFIFDVFCCFCFYVIFHDDKNPDQLKGILIFGFFVVALWITKIIIAPRWCRWYVFRKDAFECHILLRKKIKIPYNEINISYASYFHGTPAGIGKTRYYIVFSQRKLSRYEQDHINDVSPKGVYKLVYTKRLSKCLKSVLSGRSLNQFISAENTINRLQTV